MSKVLCRHYGQNELILQIFKFKILANKVEVFKLVPILVWYQRSQKSSAKSSTYPIALYLQTSSDCSVIKECTCSIHPLFPSSPRKKFKYFSSLCSKNMSPRLFFMQQWSALTDKIRPVLRGLGSECQINSAAAAWLSACRRRRLLVSLRNVLLLYIHNPTTLRLHIRTINYTMKN